MHLYLLNFFLQIPTHMALFPVHMCMTPRYGLQKFNDLINLRLDQASKVESIGAEIRMFYYNNNAQFATTCLSGFLCY